MLVDVTDSAPLEVAALKATVGVASSSVIVYVCVVVPPNVAFTGAESRTDTVSFTSSSASFTTLIPTFWLVTPGLNVNVPEARV
jgi:hypothetical protein